MNELIADLEEEIAFWNEHEEPSRLVTTLQRALSALQEAQKARSWQPVGKFQQEANEGWCWIVYKGRVTEAYHDHNQFFRFHRLSDNCYMTECISAVMPWDRPSPPETNKE